MNPTIILDYETPNQIRDAATFCASLYSRGIAFTARQACQTLEITLSGY